MFTAGVTGLTSIKSRGIVSIFTNVLATQHIQATETREEQRNTDKPHSHKTFLTNFLLTEEQTFSGFPRSTEEVHNIYFLTCVCRSLMFWMHSASPPAISFMKVFWVLRHVWVPELPTFDGYQKRREKMELLSDQTRGMAGGLFVVSCCNRNTICRTHSLHWELALAAFLLQDS